MLTGIAAGFFYLFAAVTVASALMVVAARNPVHSVLFLILCFFNSAALFLLLGAEFLAMILLIVYVGAVAVLFLFVVMMLDVDFSEMKARSAGYGPVGALIGLVLLAELAIVLGGSSLGPDVAGRIAMPMPDVSIRENTAALGDVLYTDYIYFFQIAGLILLVAMVGAITLTLRHREGTKRQNISVQVARNPESAIEVRHAETGKGI